MNDYEFNPGILLGGAAAVLSIFAALAALYLWAVNKGRAVAPWLSPLLLPTLVILSLALVAQLWRAYEERSWPEASNMIITAWAAFMILVFWLKLRKQT